MDCWKAVQRSEGAPRTLAPLQGLVGAQECDGSRLSLYTESVVMESSLFALCSRNVSETKDMLPDDIVHVVKQIRSDGDLFLFFGRRLEFLNI